MQFDGIRVSASLSFTPVFLQDHGWRILPQSPARAHDVFTRLAVHSRICLSLWPGSHKVWWVINLNFWLSEEQKYAPFAKTVQIWCSPSNINKCDLGFDSTWCWHLLSHPHARHQLQKSVFAGMHVERFSVEQTLHFPDLACQAARWSIESE